MNIIDRLTSELLEKDLVINYNKDEDMYYISNGVQQLSFTYQQIRINLYYYGYRSFVNSLKKDLNLMSRC